MAVAFVKGTHTKGNENLNKITVSATAGNMLVVLLSQNSSVLEPKFSDNLGGTWVINATNCKPTTTSSTWIATKKAVGTETEVKGEPGALGTVVGMAYSEISGSSEVIDKIAATNEIASSKEGKTAEYTNTDAKAYLLVASCAMASQGTVEAWTQTGAALTNDETALVAKVFIGHAVLTEAQTAKTWTSHHSAATTMGMLVVTFKEAGGETLSAKPTVKYTLQDTLVGAEGFAIKGTITDTLKDVAQAVQSLGLKLTAKFVLDDKFAGLQKLALVLNERLSLAQSTVVIQTTGAKFTSKMVLADSLKATAEVKFLASLNVGLALADKVAAAQLLAVSPTSKIVIADGLTVAQAMSITGSSRLSSVLHATITVKEQKAGKTVIFIFED